MNKPHRPSTIPWWSRLLQPWFAATLFIAWYLWQLPLQKQYDSVELYHGCRDILDWLVGYSRSIGNARPFPLFQYLSGVPALWAARRGLPVNIVVIWSASSLLSFAGIITVFHVVARRMNRPDVGWAIMVVMLSGPLLMYARSTFNELVSAFLILCFTAAVTGRASAVPCAALFCLSGITKETAPPMLAAIWLASLWAQRSQENRRRLLAHKLAFAVALVLTTATNFAFNFLRYRTIWNRDYLQPDMLVHSWPHRAQNSLALWISTNGGVVVFWPTLAIAMTAVMVIALRSRQNRLPALVVAVVLGGLTVGLAGFYQPFGWWAWGPRLILPWLPAVILILLRGYPDAFALCLDRSVRRPRAFAITAAFICISTLPHILAAANPSVVQHFFASDWRFPRVVQPDQPEQHYALNVYLAWQKMPPMLLRPMMEGFTLLQILETGCFLVALITLLRQCQRSIAREQGPLYPSARPEPPALY